MSGMKIETSCWFRTLGQIKADGVGNWHGRWKDGKVESPQTLDTEPLVSAQRVQPEKVLRARSRVR